MPDSKKIKILFRHRSMEMGGVEKVLLSVLHNLDQEKFECTVLLSINQGELRNEFPQHVKKLYLADGKEDFSKNIIFQKIQMFKRKRKLDFLLKNPKIIDEKILKDTYDVEIAMTYNDFPLVLNSTNKNSKKIGWFHSEIQVPGLQPLVPMILDSFPRFNQIVYCSQRIYDLMHKHYPNLKYPHEKVIINTIPIEEIKHKAEEKITDFPIAPVFVSVGRLHYRKGYHKLIEAHKQLLDDGILHHIVIVGDGEQRSFLENLIKEKKVEKTFLLIGNRMNPYPYIKNADFFILPSESEAWPLVIAEALILQKPTIATNTGDVSSMISDGKTGRLISYETSEIYTAMKEFLTNKKGVSEIKENLTTIENQFDNQKIFDAVEEMILKLITN